MKEYITLVFADGTHFKWKTTSIHDGRMAMRLQKKKGHPKEIIGDGPVANLLREKYRVFNENPETYKPDVFGTASKLSGMTTDLIKEKFEKVTKRLRK